MTAITVTDSLVRPLPGALTIRCKAGAALNVGDAVYMASDGDIEAADADAGASAQVIGIVVSAPYGRLDVADQEWCDVVIHGRVTGFSGMTPGGLAYIGTTAGVLDDTRPAGSSGDYVWIVGTALTATELLINPFTDDFAAQ